MRATAKIVPTRMPVLSPVRLGHHRYFPAITLRVRASLAMRRLAVMAQASGLPSPAGTVSIPCEARRPADARHAA